MIAEWFNACWYKLEELCDKLMTKRKKACLVGGEWEVKVYQTIGRWDGTVHISREMHKQSFITRPEMTGRAPKPHRHRSRTFL